MTVVIDRRSGLSSAISIKGLVRLATTANITLYGFQTIDGVLPTEAEHPRYRRILVKDQTDAAENGIYEMGIRSWQRTTDFNSVHDWGQGTRVIVWGGNTQHGEYAVTTAMNPASFAIGTDDIEFARVAGNSAQSPISVLNYIPTSLHEGIADGTNATALQTYIQTAVDDAEGNVLYFPPGTYLVSGSTATGCVELPTGGIRLQGAGKYLTTIQMAAATAAAAFTCIDGDKLEIDGIAIDGQNTTRVAWQRGLVLRGVQDSAITNCRFYRVGDGAVLYGMAGFGGSDSYGEGTRQPKRARVSGCEWVDARGTVCLLSKYTGMEEWEITNNAFRDSCSIAISIESEQADPSHIAKRTVITGNRISGCSYTYTGGLSAVAWGIAYGELAQDCVIANNIIDGVAGDTVAAGILISTSPSQDDEDTSTVVVSANTIRSVTGASGRAHGVLVQAGDTDTTDVSIQGNVISDCEDGISFECDASAATLGYVRGVSVIGNTVTDVTEFGVWTANVSSSGSIPLLDAVISGNVIRGSGSHGMSLHIENSVIAGNKIDDAGGVGLSLLTGSERLTISGNNITNSVSDGVQGAFADSMFIGNVIMNNGLGGGTTYALRITTGGNNLIHGNNLSDDQGVPTQSWGFRSATATDRCFHNDMLGNASGSVFGGIASVNDGTFDLALNRTANSGGNWLEDPGADRIRFWDESGNIEQWLTAGTYLAITTTTIDVTSGVAKVDTEDQVITGGARVTSKDLGTVSTGTLTPDPGDRPLQHYSNGGAHTLAPSTNTGSFMLDITNSTAAGTITASTGWTKVIGDSLTTSSGHTFRCSVSIGSGGSLLSVTAVSTV